MMVTTQYPVYRILGTHNVRDLGGYRTKGGKITKTERFIRSDSLHRIGAEGIKFLLEKNLQPDALLEQSVRCTACSVPLVGHKRD